MLSENANRIDNELIITADMHQVKQIINDAPADKKESWEVFKGYLEEQSPKTFANVKKLGKLIEYLINKSK
jgi:hypothetical protein